MKKKRKPRKKKVNSQLQLKKALASFSAGDLTKAQLYCSEIIEINPTCAGAWNLLGAIALKLSQDKEAVGLFQRAVVLEGSNAGFIVNLALALKRVGQLDSAMEFLRIAHDIEPDKVEIDIEICRLLAQMNEQKKAIAACQQLLGDGKQKLEVKHVLAEIYSQTGDHAEAASLYAELLQDAPEMHGVHFSLGITLISLGDFDLAEEHIRQMLVHYPLHAESHRVLAWLQKYTSIHDEHLKLMETIIKRADCSHEQRMHLGFGLGKAYQDTGDFDQSFHYFKLANDLKRNSYGYDPQEHIDFADKLTGFFNEHFIATQHGERSGRGPVFILGMPRSGTTLVEQILSSHSQMEGIGESAAMRITLKTFCSHPNGELNLEPLLGFSRQKFLDMGAFYMQQLQDCGDGVVVIDKTPTNFFYVGLIYLMLPGARIIHTTRNPMDTCLSIYQTYLVGSVHRYAFNLKELGMYYRLYLRMMEHWRRVIQPGLMLDVAYESLIADQEAESRRMIKFAGFNWEDACLNFHQNSRAVQTASASQVRQPIYNSSVQRWKRYEKHLIVLQQALTGEQI